MPVDGTFYEPQRLDDFFKASGGFDQIPKDYYIGIGDHLDIVFPVNRDLNLLDIVVRRDGRISLPYLGDEMAAGRTPMGLDSVLTSRYMEYLKTPELSVIVRESPAKLVYVVGQVREPGGFATNLDVSLVQALSLAKGFLDGAKRENVVVIRRMSPDRVIGVEINVKEILEGSAIQNDIMLRDYDIVYVPKTRLKSATEIATLINDLVKTPTSLITTGWFAINLYTAYEYYKTRV
ncbi:MAG: polysaccharide export protein [Chitinivibrionia bacterium]|nr:polysaccharide export protein [Chitinivibrionia bacterium]